MRAFRTLANANNATIDLFKAGPVALRGYSVALRGQAQTTTSACNDRLTVSPLNKCHPACLVAAIQLTLGDRRLRYKRRVRPRWPPCAASGTCPA